MGNPHKLNERTKMFIFCNNIKDLSKLDLRNIIACIQTEIDSRAPELTMTQLAMARGLLNEGFRIGLIKELRVWFPEMSLKEAKLAMEAIEAKYGPKRES